MTRHTLAAGTVLTLALLTPCAAHAQDEPPLEPLPPAPGAPAAPAEPAPAPLPPAPAPATDLPREAPPPYVAIPAPAPAARFGAAGQKLITSAMSVGIASTSFKDTSTSVLSVGFSPGIDYFVVRNVSIGADVDIGYDSQEAGEGVAHRKLSTQRFGAGVRVGIVFPLSSAISWYPRFTFGGQSRTTKTESGALGSPVDIDRTDTAGFLTLYAPLVLQPAPHLMLGFGPGITREIGDRSRTTVYGQFVLGTFWGGEPDAALATTDATAAPARVVKGPRFGDAGRWVVTGETRASLSWSTPNGESRDGDVTSLAFAPGVDVFVASHLSLGGQVFLGTTYDSGFRQSQLGGGARVGYEIPLGERFSLWPRLGIAVARLITNDDSSGSNSYATAATMSLGVPVLWHVASHGFLGFGPYVKQDVVRSYDGGTSGNVGTELGASFLVGGWL